MRAIAREIFAHPRSVCTLPVLEGGGPQGSVLGLFLLWLNRSQELSDSTATKLIPLVTFKSK